MNFKYVEGSCNAPILGIEGAEKDHERPQSPQPVYEPR
jgi:hypothetical protein